MESSLHGDESPLDFVEAGDQWVFGIGGTTLGDVADTAGYVGDDRGDRGELGSVWMHGRSMAGKVAGWVGP